MSDDWIDKNELHSLVSGVSGTTPPQPQPFEDIFDDIPATNYPPSQNSHQAAPYHSGPIYSNSPPSQTPLQVLVNPPELQPQYQPHQQPQTPVIPAEPYNQSFAPNPYHQTSHAPAPAHWVAPSQHPEIVQEPEPVYVEPATGKISSPFALDEEEDLEDIEDQIQKLKSDAVQALAALQEAREKADKNGLIRKPVEAEPEPEEVIEETPPDSVEEPSDETEPDEQVVEEIEEEEEVESIPNPLDRIPLDVEIDPFLSLNGRLRALAAILEEYVGMQEMMLVDQNGFSLFETKNNSGISKCVNQYIKAIRQIYNSEKDQRTLSSSQIMVDNDKWLCLIPSDGDVEGQFMLKIMLPIPMDRPEIYVLIELLNEVLRPELESK